MGGAVRQSKRLPRTLARVPGNQRHGENSSAIGRYSFTSGSSMPNSFSTIVSEAISFPDSSTMALQAQYGSKHGVQHPAGQISQVTAQQDSSPKPTPPQGSPVEITGGPTVTVPPGHPTAKIIQVTLTTTVKSFALCITLFLLFLEPGPNQTPTKTT
jgi:hypothetical protein